MKSILVLAAALVLATGPAAACDENMCDRGEERAGPPPRPDVKPQKTEQVAPLSVPAPDAKAPAKPAAPGIKTACTDSDGCADNRGK